MFSLTVAFTATGDVSDYNSEVQQQLLTVIAAAAGLSRVPKGARLTIRAGSVQLVATLPLASQAAAVRASAIFAAAAPSASALTTLWSGVALLAGVTAQSVPVLNPTVQPSIRGRAYGVWYYSRWPTYPVLGGLGFFLLMAVLIGTICMCNGTAPKASAPPVVAVAVARPNDREVSKVEEGLLKV